jgi:hypothetical protein
MPFIPGTIIDQKEVTNRAVAAGRIIDGCSREFPSLASRWQPVGASLADIPVLVSDLSELSGSLVTQRRHRANLAGAAKARLAACADRDDDPLGYLRDELAEQGYLLSREQS